MAIAEDSGVKEKEFEISKSDQRIKKNVGSENQCCTNCIGGFRNSAVAIQQVDTLIQKSALLGSARILRKVLEM